MLLALLLAGLFVTSLLAVLVHRLLPAILWLAAASALLAVALYTLGAVELAVIELSVGAGLVTVLYVFAVNVAGAGAGNNEPGGRQIIGRRLAAALVLTALVPLGWLSLVRFSPATVTPDVAAQTFAANFWQARLLDVLLQLFLIVTGVIGVLGLLGETEAPRIVAQPPAVELEAEAPVEEVAGPRPLVREKEPV